MDDRGEDAPIGECSQSMKIKSNPAPPTSLSPSAANEIDFSSRGNCPIANFKIGNQLTHLATSALGNPRA